MAIGDLIQMSSPAVDTDAERLVAAQALPCTRPSR